MELRHLRYFVAVADAGSMSRAAEKLFVAQPPLSLQMKHLEEEIGQPLFVRHPKGVRLTPAGERLLAEARKLLDHASQLAGAARGAARAAVGTLTLGYVPSASRIVLPDLVRRLRAIHPGLTLRFSEMISDDQVAALIAGHIDAGLTRSAAHHARVVAVCGVADPFCLALPTARSAAVLGAGSAAVVAAQSARDAGVLDLVDLKRFADADFVAFTRHRGPAYFDQATHLCTRSGFSPRIRYEASTVHGVLDLVSAGLGVALVPASAALLGVRGVRVRALKRRGAVEMLSLLRRKSDSNPLLGDLEAAVATILEAVARRAAAATVA